MILRVKTHKTCRNGGKTRKSLKSYKTVTTRKNVKNVSFSRLNQNVTECKIRNVKNFDFVPVSQSHNLFSFSIPTRPGDHPHLTGDFGPVSHSP
jgi:hypothetical protein